VKLQPGADPSAIDEFCSKRKIELPLLLRKLLVSVNGFAYPGDQDMNGFTFWDLERLELTDRYDGGTHAFPGAQAYLLFCDYLGWSWAYAVRVKGEKHGEVVMVGTQDGSPLHLADSFEEFLRAYLDDAPVLYGS